MKEEEWARVPMTYFEVSTLGNVRSVGRWIWYYRGQKRWLPGKEISPDQDSRGYRRATLSQPGERDRKILVHRMVLEAHVGPCPEGHQADHINRIPSDNRLENLRWLPARENMGRDSREVHAIPCELQKDGVGIWAPSMEDMARKIGASAPNISMVLSSKAGTQKTVKGYSPISIGE